METTGNTFKLVKAEGSDVTVKVWDTPVTHSVQCPNGHAAGSYKSRQDAKNVSVRCTNCGANMKVTGTVFGSSLAA